MSATESGLVSVIMPTYNRGYIIQRAIDSVKQQEYKNWELIIVDDGSTDDTAAVVGKNAAANIRYIAYSPNQGGNHARNVGMAAARGEYLAFLDTDNIWLPEFLQSRVQALEEKNADLVFGGVKRVFESYDSFFPIAPGESAARLTDRESLLQAMLQSNQIDTNTVLLKRACYEVSGGFDEKMRRLQDWEFFFRLVADEGLRIAFEHNYLGENYIFNDSISKKQELYFSAHSYLLRKHKRLIDKYNAMTQAVFSVVRMLVAESIRVEKADIARLLALVPEAQKGDAFAEVFALLYEKHTELCAVTAARDSLRADVKILHGSVAREKRIKRLAGKWLFDKHYAAKIYAKLGHGQRLAIYGYGVLGKALYHELMALGAEITAVVDKNVKAAPVTCSSLEQLTDADILLVTAICDFAEIKAEAAAHNEKLQVVSVEELTE